MLDTPKIEGKATRATDLLQQVGRQHEDFSIWSKALHSSEVAYALLVILGRRHDLKDVEGGPRHVVADHLEVDELEQGRSLDICKYMSDKAGIVDLTRRIVSRI